ncbi:hypothetical protein JCM10908_002557 [Rhodotorula pacifica]|uniref:F-box protein n=1 Tax=Rhodotorula pacifica TaxID=1495444 RepID=UPI003181F720
MTNRRLSEAKPQYTPPALFFQLEREFKAARRSTATKTKSTVKSAKKQADPPKRHAKHVKRSTAPSPQLNAVKDGEIDMLASDDDAEDLDAEILRLASGKKRRGFNKRKQVQRGATGESEEEELPPLSLSNLPKELLEMIFAHLSLDGLHALSSASRQFHDMLKPEKNLDLWQDALNSLDELPDQSECELTFSQIAELLYGRSCTDCGRRAGRWADWFLRRRLCGKCRTQNVVRLSALAEHPELHSAAGQCVLNSRHSNASHGPQTLIKNTYGYLPDLVRQSDKLWRLEEKDQDDEAVTFSRAQLLTPPPDDKQPSHAARRSVTSAYCWAPPRAEGEYGARVKKYIKQRRAKLEPFEKYGLEMHAAVTGLYAREDAEAANAVPVAARRQAIELRVLAETEYTAEDFHGSWLTETLVNRGSSTISDLEWTRIKPKILKILKSVRQAAALRDLQAQQAQRRESLREYYQKYREGLPTHAAVCLPLFADFALLPAVRALWQPQEAVVSRATWNAALEALEEDINEWRVSLRLYALTRIFLATYDIPENEELATDADDYALWGDDYFDYLPSAFMCDISGCYRSERRDDGGRPTFFGSLPDLLQHQHQVHGELDLPVATYTDIRSAPLFRFSLPLEIANAVVAICQLLRLEETSTTEADIDAKFAEDPKATLQWWNVPVPTEVAMRMKAKGRREVHKDKIGWWTKPGPKEREWRKVLCHIYREAVKGQRAKPPYHLTIPNLTLWSEKLSSRQGADNAEEED